MIFPICLGSYIFIFNVTSWPNQILNRKFGKVLVARPDSTGIIASDMLAEVRLLIKSASSLNDIYFYKYVMKFD